MRETSFRTVGAALRRARRTRSLQLWSAAVCAALIAVLVWTVASPPRPRLLWNASASAPIGLWRVVPDVAVGRGDMVVARLGQPWRGLAARRHYLPANVPLLKRVRAVAGDRVCAFGPWIFVEGRVVAVRRHTDRRGRPLPWWHGCMTLRAGATLLLMDDPASFDGRYFGPVEGDAIAGKAVPLWLR